MSSIRSAGMAVLALSVAYGSQAVRGEQPTLVHARGAVEQEAVAPSGAAAASLGIREPVDRRAAAARIRLALDTETVEVSFIDTPLWELLEYLADAHPVRILLDERALHDAEISTDEPVTLHLSGVTLRSLLNVLLEPLDLGYVVEDQVLKVTTRAVADAKRDTRIYDVRRLTPDEGLTARLGRLIVAAVEPETWRDAGGKGVLESVDGLLVVTQNERVHDQVGEFLRELGRLAGEGRAPSTE